VLMLKPLLWQHEIENIRRFCKSNPKALFFLVSVWPLYSIGWSRIAVAASIHTI
jgi:hypothetical protein